MIKTKHCTYLVQVMQIDLSDNVRDKVNHLLHLGHEKLEPTINRKEIETDAQTSGTRMSCGRSLTVWIADTKPAVGCGWVCGRGVGQGWPHTCRRILKHVSWLREKGVLCEAV